MFRHRRALVAAALAACAAAPFGAAAQGWPDKTILMALGRELKHPVVIENRAGSGGALGIGAAARAPADGYTVLLSLSSISILPEADKILGRTQQFQMEQFVPIARFTADPTVFVVRGDAPWKTLAEFVADAKSKPGAYNYGSSGNYGTMHVPMEMLKAAAGFSMTHIPYTGAGPAVTALLGGQVDAIASGPATVAQHVKAGKMRALGHWGEQPLQALPDVPSLKQLGHPVQFAQWSGLFVPVGTPNDVVQKLRAAARKVAADPAVVQTIGRAGSPIAYLDQAEFQSYWASDAKVMTDAVRKIGKVE
jgi:tripartite-type tricarboxylate transporter receptor subunit TctC